MEKKMGERTEILRVLVGSRAHGLADKDSDYDYRSVYVDPTSEILRIGHNYKGSSWTEGKEDNTAYEIGHFLHLAIRSNPTILEIFRAPIIDANEDGLALRELFPFVWNPNDAFNAFVGYGKNQRKKFLDKKDHRENKFACAYIRTLVNLLSLLMDGEFKLEVVESIRPYLLRYRNGDYRSGEIIDKAEEITERCRVYLEDCEHEADVNKVNDFLLQTRRRYW